MTTLWQALQSCLISAPLKQVAILVSSLDIQLFMAASGKYDNGKYNLHGRRSGLFQWSTGMQILNN